MTADWPFGTDADRDDPLAALRIPAVHSFNPQWRYVAAYCKPESETGLYWGSAERPTDAEARMIASFIGEYLHHWFRPGYIQRLAERPLDVDGGCNTVIFVKYGPDDWGYRRVSWERGPLFVPLAPRMREGKDGVQPGPLTLEQVMDRVHTICDEPMPHWTDWKAAHPDVFPAAVEATP